MTPAPLIAEIQAATCAAFGIPLIEMRSERRARAVAHPRQVAMFLSHRHTTHSLPSIGRLFGGRDHSTVIHAIRRVTERLASEADLPRIIANIETRMRRQAKKRSAGLAVRHD